MIKEKENSKTKIDMKEKDILKNLVDLLEEKYEPILVVQLLRVPPESQLRAFAQKLMNDFGYKILILPGDVETKVELISVLTSDVKKVEDLQARVITLIKDLEEEYKEVLTPVQNLETKSDEE